MPRTAKQLANLRPVPIDSTERAKKIGSLGGKASARKAKERKTIRETLLILLETKGKDGKTMRESVSMALMMKALSGNVEAIKTLRDSIGESPTAKIEVSETQPKRTAKELFAELQKLKK